MGEEEPRIQIVKTMLNQFPKLRKWTKKYLKKRRDLSVEAEILELKKELKQDIRCLEAEIQLHKLDDQGRKVALLLLNHCKELTKLIKEQLCDER